MSVNKVAKILLSVLLAAGIFSGVGAAQTRAVYDEGALGLEGSLKRLNTSATVLMIGAHPDDEDTALLAYLARGEGARTAYLSLTRGDGGQNLIGPELGESLGVIRTEELIQARRLDGAEQYFTRAYDFGYSKTLAETREKWDEKIVLCDVVRVIREFRPLVIVSQFNGTPADGHGQHQYAGYISPLAAEAAADVNQCNGAGPVWKIRKFYRRFRGGGEPTLRINTGKYDPLLGRSYFEIAMRARSQHKSQGQGALELKGEQFSALTLSGMPMRESGIFDSVKTSVSAIAMNTGNTEDVLAGKLARLQQIAADARQQFDRSSPEKILKLLADGYALASEIGRSTQNDASKAFLGQKRREFLAALRLAAGIQIDALADREIVVSGENFGVNVRLFAASARAVTVNEISLRTREGTKVLPSEQPPEKNPVSGRRESPNASAYFRTTLAGERNSTEPYWLERPREGDLYRWPNEPGVTLPFRAPPLTAEVRLKVEGRAIEISVPVEYRFADDARGEIRRELNLVPAITLELDQELIIVPKAKMEQTRRIMVSLVNNSGNAQSGKISIDLRRVARKGKISDYTRNFVLTRRGEKAVFTFDIRIPADLQPAAYLLYAQASTISAGSKDATVYSQKLNTVSYPHITTHRFYRKAKTVVRIVDLAVSRVNAGYIAGTGDSVAEAMRQMGVRVEMLNENELASSDLSRFDVIVVGVRAYQVRQDLIDNNKRLLDFAAKGGTLIIQYQLPFFADREFLPYPAKIGPRVTDENAEVTVLRPENPILNFPNKIDPNDFAGWVQERSLYNFSTFDSRYVPILEAHDPGETANNGGLMVADLGKGKYVYCSYSLFRQLPAGVPGAYRLLANMLSLKSAPK